jgi:hypothetical protein
MSWWYGVVTSTDTDAVVPAGNAEEVTPGRHKESKTP